MPAIKVTLSPKLTSSDRKELALELSAASARLLGKPEAYVQVMITDDTVMSFGGDAETPTAFAVLLSIGGFADGVTAKLSAEFAAVFAKFGVPKERLYINFSAQKGVNWGWNGDTF